MESESSTLPGIGRAIVTGASSGIGAALSRALSTRGVRLLLVARRLQALEEVAAQCRELGAADVVVSSHDLSAAGQGVKVVEEGLERLGGLDCLACNAGYGIFGPTTEIDPEQMRRIWQVNFQSAYESIHRALPHFLEQGSGKIVLTSSIVGKKGMSFAAAYSATKFAQVGLGEALWGELRGRGVDVTVVCPGFTATEFHDSAGRVGGTPGIERRLPGQSPDRVAEEIVRALDRSRREIHLTRAGKLLLLLDRMSPGLATRVMAWVGRRELDPSLHHSQSSGGA